LEKSRKVEILGIIFAVKHIETSEIRFITCTLFQNCFVVAGIVVWLCCCCCVVVVATGVGVVLAILLVLLPHCMRLEKIRKKIHRLFLKLKIKIFMPKFDFIQNRRNSYAKISCKTLPCALKTWQHQQNNTIPNNFVHHTFYLYPAKRYGVFWGCIRAPQSLKKSNQQNNSERVCML